MSTNNNPAPAMGADPIARAKQHLEAAIRVCDGATPGPWAHARLSDGFSLGKVFAGMMNVCDIRGWGHLTGIGALALSNDVALEIQSANAEFIAQARTFGPAALKLALGLLEQGHAADCDSIWGWGKKEPCDCATSKLAAAFNAALEGDGNE